MVIVSLLSFLQTGRFGPIRVGSNRTELESQIGPPEDTGGTSRNHPHPVIWKYEDIEFHFDRETGELSMIHIDRFTGDEDSPRGWGCLQIAPWIVRSGLPLSEFLTALDDQPVAYNVQHKMEWGQIIVTTGSEVLIGFGDGIDDPDFAGLAYITMSAT